MEHSYWSRYLEILCSDWLNSYCHLLQLSYALETQFKAPKAPYKGHYLLFFLSVCTERIYYKGIIEAGWQQISSETFSSYLERFNISNKMQLNLGLNYK